MSKRKPRTGVLALFRRQRIRCKFTPRIRFHTAHKSRGTDEGHLAERGFQLHDLFHVLTGYDTTPLGEVKVVSFTVAQAPAPYPAMIIASRPLQMVLYQPELLPFVMDAITEGWTRGHG